MNTTKTLQTEAMTSPKNIQKAKKFLFIAPYNQYATGCRQLASGLIQASYDVNVLIFKKYDMNGAVLCITEKEEQLLAEYLASYQPDFVAVSLFNKCQLDEKWLFDFLRGHMHPAAILACGGFGPTFESERFLRYGADYALRGEGDGCLLDIARAMDKNEDIRLIDNVCYLKDDCLVENPIRPLIESLDTVPPFLQGTEHIFCIENNTLRQYDPILEDTGMYMIQASSGCTGRCTYCCSGNWVDLYKNKCGKVKRYRSRSVEHILRELEEAKKKGATYIYFLDEYFARSEDKFNSFFKQYKERIDLPFLLLLHPQFMLKDRKRFDLTVKAGLNYIVVGIQSANRHIVKDIFQRKTNTEEQFTFICQLHEARVSTEINFITAHALEGEVEYGDSLELMKRIPYDPSWPMRTVAQVFPLELRPGAPIGSMYPVLEENPVPVNIQRHKTWMLYLRHII